MEVYPESKQRSQSRRRVTESSQEILTNGSDSVIKIKQRDTKKRRDEGRQD